MIFLHRARNYPSRNRQKCDYLLDYGHILHTPFEPYEQERYREWFYKQIRRNPEFKETAHDLCWKYIECRRLDLYTTTTAEQTDCWINVIKEYIFDKYKTWLKQEKGKCP